MPVGDPPSEVLHGFDWACNFWASIDVETHDLAPPSDRVWEVGEFGHLRHRTGIARIRALRIVQIGWTVGDFDSSDPPVTKVRLMKPGGFKVTLAATRAHNITQEPSLSNFLRLHVLDQNLHVLDQNLHVHVRDLFRWPYKRVPSRVTLQASKH